MSFFGVWDQLIGFIAGLFMLFVPAAQQPTAPPISTSTSVQSNENLSRQVGQNSAANNIAAASSTASFVTESTATSSLDFNGPFSWVPVSDLPSLFLIKNGQVYVSGTEVDSSGLNVMIPSANVAQLEIAINEAGLPTPYLKDSANVYFLHTAGGAEPNTISVGNIVLLEGADPATFMPMYAIPIIPSFSAQQITDIIGPTSTEQINGTTVAGHNWQCLYDAFGKDKSKVYFQDGEIFGADPNSFTITFDNYGCPVINFNYDQPG
jgi:hypothetical protein